MDVDDNCLAACKQSTLIDPAQLTENTILGAYLKHDSICDHGRYSTVKLLMIGFLFCS